MVKLMNGTMTSPSVYFIDKEEFIKNDGSVINMQSYRTRSIEDFFFSVKNAKEVYIFTKEQLISEGQRFVIIKAAVLN